MKIVAGMFGFIEIEIFICLDYLLIVLNWVFVFFGFLLIIKIDNPIQQARDKKGEGIASKLGNYLIIPMNYVGGLMLAKIRLKYHILSYYFLQKINAMQHKSSMYGDQRK